MARTRSAKQSLPADAETRATQPPPATPSVPTITGPATTAAPTTAPSASSSASSRPAFRFLDLPPEIRNRIYTYVILESTGAVALNLANFKEPAITAVSHQVRNESLPVMFAECTFNILVGSNLRKHSAVRRSIRLRGHKNDTARAGTLGVKREVMKFIKGSKGTAVFRHVTFKVCDVSDLHATQSHIHVKYPEVYVVGTLSLGYTSKQLEIATSTGAICASVFAFEAVDRDAAIHEAATVARELSERDGFMGFSVHDLDKVAKGFRFAS